MKKFILLIALAIGFLSISAQTVKKYTLPVNQYFWNYTGTAADTLGVGQTTWGYETIINKQDGFFYNIRVKVSDKTTGGAGVGTIKLQGKHFSTDAYSDITTISWTGVGSTDTIAPFSQVTTKQYYRYLKILVTRTGGLIKVDYIKNSLKKN